MGKPSLLVELLIGIGALMLFGASGVAIMAALRNLIPGVFAKWECHHEWEVVKELKETYTRHHATPPLKTTEETRYILYCCKKCGKFKEITR